MPRLTENSIINEEEGTAWAWVPLKDADGEPSDWAAAALFLLIDERPVLCELRVVPVEPRDFGDFGNWSREPDDVSDREGIPMGLLQNLRLHELYEPIQHFAQNLGRMKGQLLGPDFHELVWRQLESTRGSAHKDDLYFAKWAAQISELTTTPGTARAPIAALAEASGLTREQIRDIAHKAREREVLTKPLQGGRGGGILTEYGKSLLKEEVKRNKSTTSKKPDFRVGDEVSIEAKNSTTAAKAATPRKARTR